MLRRVLTGASTAAIAACSTAATAACASRAYRVVPHIDWEIEELAETQQAGRWQIQFKGNYQSPETPAEIMCHKLNVREARRRGVLPEKALARKLSNQYGVEGTVYAPPVGYRAKTISFTVVGFDGHPFHFRVPPMPDTTVNALIDGSGMNHGHGHFWNKCCNRDCQDPMHGEGCLINVDLETLDRLLPPGRFEYMHLNAHRMNGARPDLSFTTRFSCQIKITEELDGALFALKQINAPNLMAQTIDWSASDDLATIGYNGCRKVEPFAPYLESPTEVDFPITMDMLWTDDWEDIMMHKYPDWRRKDGYHTKPRYWVPYV